MKIQVSLKNYRRSARKVREIIPVIKGLAVEEALEQLAFIDKAAAYDLKKLLLSGIATAENDFNLSKENLLLSNIMVQEGKTLKRWRARAYGRAAQILKRTCHILLTIEDKKDSMESTTEKNNQDRSQTTETVKRREKRANRNDQKENKEMKKAEEKKAKKIAKPEKEASDNKKPTGEKEEVSSGKVNKK